MGKAILILNLALWSSITALCQIPNISYSPPFPNNYYRAMNSGAPHIPRTFVEKKSKKHFYKIYFNDSTVVDMEGHLNMNEDKYFLSVDRGNRAIIPGETLAIHTIIDNKKLTGYALDSCWLFMIHSGKISLYSTLPESEVRFVTKIQSDGGPLMPLTRTNLSNLLEPKDPLQEMIRMGDVYGALRKYVKEEKSIKK